MASDAAEDESWGASNTITTVLKTSISIGAVTSIELNDGVLKKYFLGVSVNVTNTSSAYGADMQAPGEASLSFNGKSYSTVLSEPEPGIKESGSNVVNGNILIPASQLYIGATFPGVKVSGNFQSIGDDGVPHPLQIHGLLPFTKSYEVKFAPYTPPQK